MSHAIGARVSRTAGARALIQLPDRLILIFVCAVMAFGPLAMLGQFRAYLVLPLFAVLAAVTWRLLPETSLDASPTEQGPGSAAGVGSGAGVGSVQGSAAGLGIGAGLAVLMAVGWAGFNCLFHSELYVVVRDPAIYTLRALWLVHHASPNIDVGDGQQALKGLSGVFGDGAGFPHVGSFWQAQGTSLVPALVAGVGWLAGDQGVLNANVGIGAVGLLTVYALGRRIVGPLWALAPMGALATSMPMVAFSRAPYTEPTALVLGLGGLVLLWIAAEQSHADRRAGRPVLAALAGISLGATFLARPDGLLVVAGATVALGFVAALARSPQARRSWRLLLLAMLLGAAVSVAVALVDLARNSSVYEASTWPDIRGLLLLAGVCAVVMPLVSVLPGLDGLRRLSTARRVRVGQVTAGALGAATIALALRPLYYTAHTHGRTVEAQLVARALASRQTVEGLPVDGSRTYDEHTLTWLSWYFSWPVVILAALGVCLAIMALWRSRDAPLVPTLAVIGAVAGLYLNRVSITPDQVWAMRRFLPVVVPIGLIFAAYVPLVLSRRRPTARPVAVLLAVVITLAPVTTWRRTLITREYGGAKALTASLCGAVRGSVVVVADSSSGATIYLPTLRIACGTPAVVVTGLTVAKLLAIRRNLTDARPLVVLAFADGQIPWQVPPAGPYNSATLKLWAEPLSSRPLHTGRIVQPFWVGRVTELGTGQVSVQPAG